MSIDVVLVSLMLTFEHIQEKIQFIITEAYLEPVEHLPWSFICENR